jgi:hypothetical protein
MLVERVTGSVGLLGLITDSVRLSGLRDLAW